MTDPTIVWIALFGGIFALLVFWHFVADWLTQSHNEAMSKARDKWVRARHCLIYSLNFVPVMYVLKLSHTHMLLCFVILFVSHFIEDTYIPVLLWVKHIRRPPEFKDRGEHFASRADLVAEDRRAFIAFASTPLGKVVAIVVDQLVHIAFLMPIAYFALT